MSIDVASGLLTFSPATVARLIVAGVWLTFGLFYKVLRLVPRHEAIVASVLAVPPRTARRLTQAIGLGETGIAVWMLSGRFLIACVALQTLLIVTMNALEIRRARSLLLAPWPMVAGNLLLLGLAWFAATAR